MTEINYLGLLKRGGNIIIGTDAVVREIQLGRVHLIIVAEDLSERLSQDIIEKARHNHIRLMKCWTKRDIGNALGRGDVGVLAITDKRAAAKIQGGA